MRKEKERKRRYKEAGLRTNKYLCELTSLDNKYNKTMKVWNYFVNHVLNITPKLNCIMYIYYNNTPLLFLLCFQSYLLLLKNYWKEQTCFELLICDLSPDCLEELRGHKVVFVMSQIFDSFCLVYSGMVVYSYPCYVLFNEQE